jgi:hypothetical protein
MDDARAWCAPQKSSRFAPQECELGLARTTDELSVQFKRSESIRELKLHRRMPMTSARSVLAVLAGFNFSEVPSGVLMSNETQDIS